MSHIPPFMLKGAAGALIAITLPSFLHQGWQNKVVATALIAVTCKVFPRLIELSQEGREAQEHPEQTILTQKALEELVEAEIATRNSQ